MKNHKRYERFHRIANNAAKKICSDRDGKLFWRLPNGFTYAGVENLIYQALLQAAKKKHPA